jgi:hypothetical protein
MGRYHCDRVSDELQRIEGVTVTNITQSSWTFKRESAKLNLRVLPGCCGVLLIYQLSGTERDLLRLLGYVARAAAKTNFGVLLMSLRSDSKLRQTLGETWTSIKFNNPRTKNDVELLSYALPQKAPKKPRPQPHEDA